MGKDADGEWTAKGYMSITGTEENADEKNQSKYAKTIAEGKIQAAFVLEKETVYYNQESTVDYTGIPEGYRQYNNRNEKERGSKTIDEIMWQDSEAGENTSPAYTTRTLLKNLPEIMQKLLPEEKGNFEGTILTYFFDMILKNGFTVTATENGYNTALDFDKIKVLVTDLADLTVSQYLDKYILDGHYADIRKFVIDALDYNAQYIVGKLDENKIDIDKIVEIINEQSKEISEEAGIEVETVEKVFGIPEGMTVREFLLSDEVKNITIAEALATSMGGTTTEDAANKVKDSIKAKFDMIEKANYINLAKNVSEDYIKQYTDYWKEVAKLTIDAYDSIMSVSVDTDKEGKFLSARFEVEMDEKIAKDIDDKYDEFLKKYPNGFEYKDEQGTYHHENTYFNFEGSSGSIVVDVTKGEFKNTLGFDYDEFVKSIKSESKNAA